MSKYKNQKYTVGGIRFDSKKEALRYAVLSSWERSGQIRSLRTQVRYELIPTQKLPYPILKGKKYQRSERPTTYIADFVYERDGHTIVEDTKGFRTKDYIIKRKLMLYIHGIQVMEV